MNTKGLFSPFEAIVPLFSNDPAAGVGRVRFEGTAFFIQFRARSYLVTADHNLVRIENGLHIRLASAIGIAHACHVVIRDAPHDLAVLMCPSYQPDDAVTIDETAPIHPNWPVTCFEYGPTLVLGDAIRIDAATRVGNITRIANLTDTFGPAGEQMLELSFPALKGASGAPVMAGTQVLWGVISKNWSHELLPTQIEEVHQADGRIDERILFLMPHGLAVSVRHLIALLAAIVE